MWPAFAVLTVADALLLGPLPIAGRGTAFVPGLLLATFFNLLAVGLVAPLLARRVRARRPDLPRVVAEDRAGTGMLVAVSVLLLAGGLAHRPARQAQERAFSAQSAAVREYVHRNAPAYRASLAAADTVEHAADLYRTCVPGTGRPPAEHPLCLLVNTDQSPPGIRVDDDRSPNPLR